MPRSIMAVINKVGREYPPVATYNDLPPAVDHPQEIYIVTTSTGIFLISRKEAGLYFSDGASWARLGNIPSYFSDANFQVFNHDDNTKVIKLDAQNITTGQTRTITVPDNDIDLTDINTLNSVTPNKAFGVVTLPTFTNTADSITINSDGVFNTSDSIEGKGNFTRKTIIGTTINITDMVTYIYLDATDSTYKATTNPTIFLSSALFNPVFRVIKDDTILCILDYDEYAVNGINKALYKDISKNAFERQAGLAISSSTGRIINISDGSIWFGYKLFSKLALVSNVDECKEVYRLAGVWYKTDVTQYDNV